MSDKETLDSMRVLFGNRVMSTNGLYHILQDDHSELYIDINKKEIDRRCRYNTIVVTDYTIVSNVLNIPGIRGVVLDKETLELLYKTSGQLTYLDENLIYDKQGNRLTFISHTGKILIAVDNARSIEILTDRKYLVKSDNAFRDTILWYRPQIDMIANVARNKKYLIYRCLNLEDSIEVVPMQGGKYIYNLKTHKCINTFTNNSENIQLFDAMIQ